MLRSLLIANRGEIVVRIARSARALGMRTIAIASDPDRDAPFTRACDRVVRIGGSTAAESYLRFDAIVDAARAGGADAVHPGYGFGSEDAAFAEAVQSAGLSWIGPPPAAMRAMADKAAARRQLAAAGVPVLPGYDDPDRSLATLRDAADALGLPLMVKATAGGGGRGMRRVDVASELDAALASAAAEAHAAFGDGRLLLERAVDGARHVEIQIVADAHGGVVHLGERDCSLQRRHQKLVEEAPSPAVSPPLRRRMGDVAVAVARATAYRGVGTVEFLLEPGGAFWFIEMNTRLQVEHAVTEALVDVDLVAWQLRIAAGEALPWTQEELLERFERGGHAIEARLCAEDPGRAFMPGSGRIVRWRAPRGVRVEHALGDGVAVPPCYDSMLAKLVAHAPTRERATARLAAALDDTVCWGVPTNRAFLARVLRDADVVAGEVDTTFLARRFPDDRSRATPPPRWLEALAAASLALLPRAPLPPLWDGWSSSPTIDRSVPIEIDGETRLWHLRGSGAAFDARADDGTCHRIERLARTRLVGEDGRGAAGAAQIAAVADAAAMAEITDSADGAGTFDVAGVATLDCDAVVDGRIVHVAACVGADGSGHWQSEGAELAATDARLRGATRARNAASGVLLAPMHGRVTAACVAAGADVAAGALLVVIEAMKMEHQIRAPHAGRVASLHVRAGDQVAARQPLVEVVA